MSESFDCIVAGHVSFDVTPLLENVGKTVAEVFRPGTLLKVGPAFVSPGGPVGPVGPSLGPVGPVGPVIPPPAFGVIALLSSNVSSIWFCSVAGLGWSGGGGGSGGGGWMSGAPPKTYSFALIVRPPRAG